MKSLLKFSLLVSVVVWFSYIFCGSNDRLLERGFYNKGDAVSSRWVSYKSSSHGLHLDIVDSVKYTRLVPNKEYTVDCGLYIRQFNSNTGLYEDIPVVLSDGTHMKGSTTFVADRADGIVRVALKGDITNDVADRSLVIYEKIR